MVGLVCVRYERDHRSYDPVGRPPTREVRPSPVMTTDTRLASEREESRVHGRAVSGRLLRRANAESECVRRRSGYTMPRNALPRPKVASARRVLRRFRGIVLPNERRDAEELGARGERSTQDEREATGESEPERGVSKRAVREDDWFGEQSEAGEPREFEQPPCERAERATERTSADWNEHGASGGVLRSVSCVVRVRGARASEAPFRPIAYGRKGSGVRRRN